MGQEISLNKTNRNDIPKKNLDKDSNKSADWQGRIVVIIGIGAAIVISIVALAEVASLVTEIFRDKIWRPNSKELENTVKNKFGEIFCSKLKQLDLDHIRLLKRFALCKNDEEKIFKELTEKFDLKSENLKEILMGAHIRLEDGGQMYKNWASSLEKNERISSHPSNAKQYGIRGPLIKELLFSTITEESGETYTWFLS